MILRLQTGNQSLSIKTYDTAFSTLFPLEADIHIQSKIQGRPYLLEYTRYGSSTGTPASCWIALIRSLFPILNSASSFFYAPVCAWIADQLQILDSFAALHKTLRHDIHKFGAIQGRTKVQVNKAFFPSMFIKSRNWVML